MRERKREGKKMTGRMRIRVGDRDRVRERKREWKKMSGRLRIREGDRDKDIDRSETMEIRREKKERKKA